MVPLPSQFPHSRAPPFIPRGRQITFSPGSSLLPSHETSAPPPWRPHRTNFTAALLPNAGDAVNLPSCTGPCASYSVLLELPRRWPREPYRSRFTPAVVHGAGAVQLRIHPESRRCFPVAIDHRDIDVSLPPVATATAPASLTRQLDLPTSPCHQIGRTLISNHFI